MTPDEIVTALTFVPEVRATTLRNRIMVLVPALGDSVHFVADDVRRVNRSLVDLRRHLASGLSNGWRG